MLGKILMLKKHQRPSIKKHKKALLSIAFISLTIVTLDSCKARTFNKSETSSFSFSSPFKLIPKNAIPTMVDIADIYNSNILKYSPNIAPPEFKKEIALGLSIAADYKLGFERLENDLVARIDTFEFKSDFSPGKSFGGKFKTFLPFEMQQGSSIIVGRVFKNAVDALKANKIKDFNLAQLPLSSDLALSLNTGDVVTIPVNSKIIVKTPSIINNLTQQIAVSPSASLIMSGMFELQIIRGQNKEVRIKITSKLSQQTTASVKQTTSLAEIPKALAFLTDFSQSAEISGTLLEGKKLKADYEIDLSDSQAKEAFDRAVSGRVTLLDGPENLSGMKLKGESFLDLSMLEDLARNTESSRVQLNSSVLTHTKEKSVSLKFALPYLSWSSTNSDSKNLITAVIPPEKPQLREVFLTKKYRAREAFKTFSFANETSLTGISIDPDKKTQMWVHLDRHQGSHLSSSERELSLAKLNKYLGPLSPTIDTEGSADSTPEIAWSEFHIAYKPELMSQLWNPALTTPKILWQAISNMVKTFEGSDVLLYDQRPYNFSSLPKYENTETNEIAANACTLVTTHWGRHYCGLFAHEIIPGILALQKTKNIDQQASFLLKYSKGEIMLNSFGPIIVTRFLAEIFFQISPQNKSFAYSKVKSPEKSKELIKSLALKSDTFTTSGDIGIDEAILEAVANAL